MWYRKRLSTESCVRQFCKGVQHRLKDEGDWFYSSEWWDPHSSGHTVLRATSDKGNGVVSVVAHPSSRPSRDLWPETERWLEQRYMEIRPGDGQNVGFKILGYQWRSLRFNDDTRQSTVKIMAACRASQPSSIFFMQQPHCLAVPYLKTMVSVGLTCLAASKYDMRSAAWGKKPMRILCIGHGGGSLPLFVATKILGAVVDIVEIDPLVISASIQAMGFPAFSVLTASGERPSPIPDIIDRVLWQGVHERLDLHESDAEEFVLKNQNLYDIIFIDAYDGADIFPHKLWDSNSLFMKALSDRLHHGHGTLVVNLHSDSDIADMDESISFSNQRRETAGKYVSKVGNAYKSRLLEDKKSGLALVCGVPWLCNSAVVVCRGLRPERSRHVVDKGTVINNLMSKSLELEQVLDLPFSCWEYMKTGLVVLD